MGAMKTRLRLLAAALVTFSCAQAASLSATASVTRALGDASLIKQQNMVSGDFLLSFTGGTGSGLFFPLVDLLGGTNESHGTFAYLGGQASLTGFAIPFMTTGDLIDPLSQNSDVRFTCSGNAACYLPFTYGQTQLVHLVATATAAVQASFGMKDPGPISAGASANFSGIVLLGLDGGRAPTGAVGTAALLPEPGSGSMVFASFAAAILIGRKRVIRQLMD